MQNPPVSERFRLGPCVVDRRARSVHVGAHRERLGSRAFDLLIALLDHRDRVVDKTELLASIWRGRVVEENTLQVHVAALRRLLGTEAIATVHGRGYRLTLQPLPTGLASPGAGLIGRDALLEEVRRALAGETRLLTLVGAGGSGKSRIAEVLADPEAWPASRWPDGIRRVALATLGDSDDLPAALLEALELSGPQPGPPEARLLGALRGSRRLLMLDNTEHLSAAPALVARLLGNCPDLVILATGRTPLGIAGERVLEVPPLALPERSMTSSAACATPAMRLLLERAEATGHDLRAHPDELDAARAICVALEGLPLALELAAARLPLMSARALQTRLHEPLDLLGGAGSAVDRHRTLRATIAWSVGLLPPSARALMARLSVFAGEASLESIIAVGDPPRGAVLDDLAALIAHQLVRRCDDAQGEPRYSMHETVREFASGLLAPAERSLARDRHADHYAAWLADADAALRSSDRLRWIGWLQAESANLRSALHWRIHGQPDPEAALTLVSRMAWWWYFAGQLDEGRRWQDAALALAGDRGSPGRRAAVLTGAARLSIYQGAMPAAVVLAEKAIELARPLGDPALLAAALFHLAIPVQVQSRERAMSAMQECRALYAEAGDRWGEALATSYMGIPLALAPGQEEPARALLQAGRRAFAELGDDWGSSTAAHYLGIIALRLGEFDAARVLTQEVCEAAEPLGDSYRVAACEQQLARIAAAGGDWPQVLVHAVAAADVHRQHGRWPHGLALLRVAARALVELGRDEFALELFAASGGAPASAGAVLMTPEESTACDEALARLEAIRPDARTGAAWTRGLALDLRAAIARARAATDMPH